MFKVESIQNGFVIDHITAGKGMEIYRLLDLEASGQSVALLQNVKRCGFIFPKQRKDEKLDDLEMYELNIQSGDARDTSDREYTQWSAEFTSTSNDRLAERIVHYVKGINSA